MKGGEDDKRIKVNGGVKQGVSYGLCMLRFGPDPSRD